MQFDCDRVDGSIGDDLGPEPMPSHGSDATGGHVLMSLPTTT
jgi:hypothetical protein